MAANPLEVKHYINGEFVSSSDGSTFDLHSPYSGDLVAKVSEATSQDVNSAVSAAKAALPSWSSLTPAQRGKPLAALADLITAADAELASLDAAAIGRPVSTYFDGHYASTHFRYFSQASYATGTSSLNTPGFLNVSLRQPYGVVAAIIPWNCPLVFYSKKVAPALAAGNTVVLKTSEKSPLSSHAVNGMLKQAGFPPGVLNVVHGHGKDAAGDFVARHMDIRALSFTGSGATGRAIQRAAADSNLKKLIFELGGKSPAIVFGDVAGVDGGQELDRAVRETQHSIMFHGGQTCMANSRIYVQREIAGEFVNKFNALAAARKHGDPAKKETMSGTLADKRQWETVKRYVEEGKKAVAGVEGGRVGLEVETGEQQQQQQQKEEEEDLFVGPVVFLQMPEDSKVMKEEVFGPVVCINVFDTEEEALKYANDSEFGLYAAVYTRDIDRALRVAKGLESGMVGVNCTSPTGAWDMPFGGYKGSGVGREGFHDSLDDWLETKAVYIRVGGSGGGAGAAVNSTLGR